MRHPDPKLHQHISFAKSGVRIGGCIVAMITGSIFALAFALLVAEVIGVVEELV